ncbi:MAG TPA: FtsX-like permease family protein [Solirubrobacter sp.]|nr:FtsX-like permease family protein [Solirubrobacter sp.]
MRELFGIPVDDLAIALAVVLGAVGAAVAVLALRHRILLRLSLRNLSRRRARAALIVVGLMLGTTIITSALVTGDTINRTIRASVIETYGATDELVSVRGAEGDRPEFFSASRFDAVDRALRATGLVDGVAPALVMPVAVQDMRSRQTEARVTLFAPDPARLAGFAPIRRPDGRTVMLSDLGPNEVYLDQDAAEELDARPGDRLHVLAGVRTIIVRVAAIVDHDGAGTDRAAVLLPLLRAQTMLAYDGLVRYVLVSNRGDETSGAALTDAVVQRSRAALAPLGLELQDVKRDGLELADEQGDVFMSVFTTFGSFSIVAGILLIFLIFVMLSAERRTELGIARAVGTRREHVVQMFVFEGLAYDLGAAAVGAALGVGISFAMVSVMASAFRSTALEIERAVAPSSLVVAYALGVLLTFVVVALSAWRVSRLNIVAAVRGLPEPLARRGRKRRVGVGVAGLVLGAAMTWSGLSAAQAMPFSLGISIAIISLIPLARTAGVPERLAYTGAGALLLVWWLLPFDTTSAIAGRELSMDFSAWIVSGLMLVAGSTWLIVYNADVLLGAAMRVAGRIRALAPVLRMAMAYPLRVRFRTGVTLAMFTLVVFTIVVGATTTRAFMSAMDDVSTYGGGFDVTAQVASTTPLGDPRAAMMREVPSTLKIVASETVLPAKMAQAGDREMVTYPLRGFDDSFLYATTYELAARAKGYGSNREVWDALSRRTDVAVIDALAAPRRDNWGFAVPPELRLHGFYLEDGTFDPVPVVVHDPRTGNSLTVNVIGVLSDTVPIEKTGLWTSHLTALTIFGPRAVPTIHHLKVLPGVDPDTAARKVEAKFLENGLEADSVQSLLDEATGASYTLNWLMLGFMGLGLIVGVAALGVISARAVVERRQQIGVLRSIGFRRGMVQLSFLLESSFIALTAIVVGTVLGLLIAYNVVSDAADQPSWQGALQFTVPWVHLAIVFVTVFAAALLTTLAPAARASRVYPAEALRYE